MPEGKPTNEEKLFDAVKSGDLTEVERLLNEGADVGARDQFGNTPLHVACYHGHTDIVRLLLERGADVGARDQFGDTPLHLACEWCAYNTIEILIERGADVGAQGEDGRTPLDYACDLDESNPAREIFMGIFQELAPEAYFTKFCESPGRMPGRGL